MLITEVLQFSLMLLFFALVLGVSYWFVLPARGPSDRTVRQRDAEPAGEKKGDRENIGRGERRR